MSHMHMDFEHRPAAQRPMQQYLAHAPHAAAAARIHTKIHEIWQLQIKRNYLTSD